MLDFQIVPFGSQEHLETIALRDAILRKPLGLKFTKEYLEAEKDDWHLAAYKNDELVGCMVLHLYDEHRLKMRQVAVAEKFQRQGIGKEMVKESHEIAVEHGFSIMFCHARDVAKDFYKKLNYEIIGDSFEEVGLKHWKMQCVLREIKETKIDPSEYEYGRIGMTSTKKVESDKPETKINQSAHIGMTSTKKVESDKPETKIDQSEYKYGNLGITSTKRVKKDPEE